MAWNRNDAAPRKVEKKRGLSPTSTWMIVGLLVVVGLTTLIILSMSDGTSKGRVSDARHPTSIENISKKVSTKKDSPDRPVLTAKGKGELEQIEVGTNSSVVVADGGRAPTNKNVTVIRSSPFAHASDQLIAMAVSSNNGLPNPPVPMSPGAEADFIKSLDTKIEILETDSDRTREIKEAVIAAREDIKARMEKGEKFTDILAEHQKNEMENFKVRRDAMLELREIVASGDVESAEKYVRTMNICFQQMGVKPLKMPGKTLQNKIKISKQKKQKDNDDE